MPEQSKQQQQEVPVQALVSIIGEQTIENRMQKVQIAQLNQMIQGLQAEKKEVQEKNATKKDDTKE